ncbi:hypothetical protein F441_20613 [Phytophthora nicotianae CJ01A1]|uniref:Uncharacterized protein n=3 Tax=Phytophthora nicotianae TaxID=4792 RepID=A0A080Z3I2_PHYNI|nr:hypothetical protein L916_20028 [Phytophthora nicotianae]ETO61190.1 hypothetical protein F444_20758 [Phytophthora nicotianae P1976]ETP02302.1 hypothetical protein F441_20613 [Phytophthora nicotianae CJ01A1]ETO61191.1 hypothetical protein, variant 1 [Phytophthora nicotianae P1976]ETO61192.1 hypothetical protein, variant 2 [Phytophthora nicotianae P1976]
MTPRREVSLRSCVNPCLLLRLAFTMYLDGGRSVMASGGEKKSVGLPLLLALDVLEIVPEPRPHLAVVSGESKAFASMRCVGNACRCREGGRSGSSLFTGMRIRGFLFTPADKFLYLLARDGSVTRAATWL